MEDNKEFVSKLETALTEKQNWFNGEKLPQILDSYRLLYTCVKNINDILVKRSLIDPDPYKFDKRISEIGTVDTAPFQEAETSQILGARLSEFEMMLDFLCTYYRFTVENIPITKLKTFSDLNNVFDWSNVSTTSTSCNTRALASVLASARINAPSITVSMINDSVEKCTKSMESINSGLGEYQDFLKELYKGTIRNDLCEHPDFDKEKAYASEEAEMGEIRKLFTKLVGKKPFYTELIQEIVDEDIGPAKEQKREKVLRKLQVKQSQTKKAKQGPNPKEMLIAATIALASMGPILNQLSEKLSDNFDLLFYERKTLLRKMVISIRKSIGIKDKERICNFIVVDKKTDARTSQRIVVSDFLGDIEKKIRIYNGIMSRGVEYSKIAGASEDACLNFLNKNIQECQLLYTWIEALDDHFKTHVNIEVRLKVKGLKIDLSSFRNAIINVNKKRSEYVSYREELEQMKKLGIATNAPKN